ncbi:MAG: hypothetical protein HZA51_12650 [Planctomycetes bacterium]|nr:hypothetical protein [Planctomycetota bacterium]
MTSLRRHVLLCCAAALAFSAIACNDPYSSRRIRMRTEHLNTTLIEAGKREESGYQRLDAAGRTLNRWLQQDADRFNKRIVTVGDYIW